MSVEYKLTPRAKENGEFLERIEKLSHSDLLTSFTYEHDVRRRMQKDMSVDNMELEHQRQKESWICREILRRIMKEDVK